VKVKLSQFCHVPVMITIPISRLLLSFYPRSCPDNPTYVQISNIVNLHDVTNIWHIPLLLRVGHFFSYGMFTINSKFTSYLTIHNGTFL
jgi:hypothetical protein